VVVLRNVRSDYGKSLKVFLWEKNSIEVWTVLLIIVVCTMVKYNLKIKK
jgi:hypothetical protein